jgi:cytoskeletal protein CcmA (bactofilin family)
MGLVSGIFQVTKAIPNVPSLSASVNPGQVPVVTVARPIEISMAAMMQVTVTLSATLIVDQEVSPQQIVIFKIQKIQIYDHGCVQRTVNYENRNTQNV